MNRAYFFYIVRTNVKILLAFTLVLCAFLAVVTNVFTPQTVASLQGATANTIASNILTSDGTLVGFMANSFYALMAILFPMVYTIFVANRLIAEKIDKGSMTGFLATPISRTQIVGASACYLVLSLAAMWATASVVGIVCADAFQPGALDRDTFLLLNLGAFLYHLAISAISFCASCVFNSSKASLIVGGGLPLLFFVISLLLKLSEDLEVLRYFTLNTLYDTQRIVDGSDYQMRLVALLVIAMVLYTCGLLIFRRKDLPL